MKKSIKSLMLIAAAAMAFTSCSKEEKISVNEGKDGVKVNFISVIDGTKTAFGESVDGKYPTLWTGDEKVGVVYADANIDKENNVVAVNGKGATTSFSATLAESASTGTVYVFAPWYPGNYADAEAGGFTNYNGTNKNANVVIPTKQVSTPTSCDPRAQLLVAKHDFTNGIGADVDVAFTHATAYGKVTIKGVDAKIKTVKIIFEDNVTGTGLYYYTADNEKYSAKAGELKAGANNNQKYVEIDNSSYACDKTFWFGIPATSCDGKAVIVSVEDENGKAYTKVINSEETTAKHLVFEQGKVSAFTVNVTAVSGEKQYVTVKELKAKGTRQISEQIYMKAIVISNKEGGNSVSLKNIVVSDGEAGIAVRFVSDVDYSLGTELEFDLMGAQTALFNNCYQINNLPNSKAEATGETCVLSPISITAADLMSDIYESMYVAVSDVQVVNEDLDKNLGNSEAHVSINMEAKTGEKFVMFTAKNATFKDEKVPQGCGVLKGIATINGTTRQIIPTLASDYAGLTGARFGDAPAFEFGTPVFTATTMKQGVAIEGGKITIPYSNAEGTEKYTVSVAVTGVAAGGIDAVANKEVSLAKGSGNIEIAITGTPANVGEVTFEISGIDALGSKTVKANVASATAANYDSNLSITENGTRLYASEVRIDGQSYSAVKFGTGSKTGAGTSTVLPKTGDATLSFYAYGWNGKTGGLKITVNNGGTINGSTSVTTAAFDGNDGCANNSPFTLTSVSTSAILTFELKGITDKSTITFETTKDNGATDPRVVIFAVNVK